MTVRERFLEKLAKRIYTDREKRIAEQCFDIGFNAARAALARPVDQGAAVYQAQRIDKLWEDISENQYKQWLDMGNAATRVMYAAPQLPSAGQGAVEVWRIFDGEGGYLYQDDAPTESKIQWAAKHGRKYEPLYATPQPSGDKPKDCSGDPLSCPDNDGYGCYCASAPQPSGEKG